MSVDLKIDELFKKAANAPIEYSLNDVKSHMDSTINSSNGSVQHPKGGSIVLKTIFIMTILLSAIVVVWMAIPSNEQTKKKQKTENTDLLNENTLVKTETSVTFNHKEPITSINKSSNQIETDEILSTELKNRSIKQERKEPTLNNESGKNPSGQKMEEPYQFPKLTPDEIADNHKRKEKMLKILAKLDKKEYAYVPSGSYNYHGSQTSVQSFYMQTAEVSNIEYKTFLFDLLINDRKEEFLRAKPDQDQWIKLIGGGMKAMTDHYFSDESYNDYPVVNVSREGAELYCTWLTVEVRKYQGGKNTRNFNDIRIPTRAEWELAASESGKNMPFPWDGVYIRNAKGCFLANFDSKQFTGLSNPMADTTSIDCADGAAFTARTKTYNPNGYGLYNLSGNVAEMVYENYTSEDGGLTKSGPGTAGGGWMSTEEELKINGIDQHSGELNAHPNVGFRVVMTYLNSSK